MLFYSGDKFPEWQGNVFVAALAGRTLWRLVLDANFGVTAREEVSVVAALGKRIRDVRQGPDGWIYLLADDGRIVRIER
jgi:glucose/arabinose dehydrogenase